MAAVDGLEGTTVQDLLQELADTRVIFETEDCKYIRVNQDLVIETSNDGQVWQATGSSGHVILNPNGTALPQRSRLQFSNSEVSDENGVTVVHGIKGDKGDQGIQGIQGPKGDKGEKGDTGLAVIPNVNSAGIISWTLGASGVVPPPQNIRGPQGVQGVQGPQGVAGPVGPQRPSRR